MDNKRRPIIKCNLTGVDVSAIQKGKDVDARDPGPNVRMSTRPVVRFGGKARSATLI